MIEITIYLVSLVFYAVSWFGMGRQAKRMKAERDSAQADAQNYVEIARGLSSQLANRAMVIEDLRQDCLTYFKLLQEIREEISTGCPNLTSIARRIEEEIQ